MAKILIAEDERDIRDLIKFTLNFAGHEVIATSNGEEAVVKAMEATPDLILMDVRMPRMTGYEACKQMKQVPALASVPVVFLSAKGQEAEVKAGMDAGAEEYLLKPFAPVQLTETINRLLAQRPAAQPAPQPQAQPAAGTQTQPAAPSPAPAQQPPPAQPRTYPWQQSQPQQLPAQTPSQPATQPQPPTRRPLTPPSMRPEPEQEPERKPWEPPSEFPHR